MTERDTTPAATPLRTALAEARTEQRLEDLSFRAGMRLWWANGIPESTLAIGVLLVAATAGITAALPASWFAADNGMFVLRIAAIAVVVNAPWVLYRRLLGPLGAGALSRARTPQWAHSAGLAALLVAGTVLGWMPGLIPETSPASALLAAGCPLALPAVALFGYSGQVRHLVLAGALVAAPPLFMVVPEGAEWLAILLIGAGFAAAGVWGILAVRRELRNPPSLEMLESAFRSADPARRYGAAELLTTWNEPRAIPWLVKACTDESDLVRSAAAVALWRVWGPDADVLFRWHLEDSGVMKLRDSQVDGDLMRALDEDFEAAEFNVRQHRATVTQALRNALDDQPEFFAQILSLAEEDSPEMPAALARDAALMLIVASGRRDGFDLALARLLGLPEPEWFGASFAFCRGDEVTLTRLEEALDANDSNPGRILSAMLDLIGEAGFDTAPFLERIHPRALSLARHADSEARSRAALILGVTGGEGALDAVLALHADEDPKVQAGALLAHARLDPEGVRPQIRSALEESDPLVRAAALDAIEATRWGHGARLLEGKLDAWAALVGDEETEELLARAVQLVRDALSW